MSTDKQAKIENKIRALLAQAADREGTPEGDTFRAKAFELMAEYGVESSKLEKGSESGIEILEFEFDKTYSDMQLMFLNNLARALHCHTISFKYGKTIEKAEVFGRPIHLDRVEMLYDILLPQMFAGSMDMVEPGPSIVIRRKSWMMGFITTIVNRVKEMEGNVEDQYSTETKSGALVLKDDYDRAMESMKKEYSGIVITRSNRKYHEGSYNSGAAAGRNTDIGQTRVSGQKALA